MLKMYRLENTAEILKDNGWIIGHTVFCVYLLILSVMDIRKRKLRLTLWAQWLWKDNDHAANQWPDPLLL